jgi:organic hydroperoxide reductase OsmC/OhrA
LFAAGWSACFMSAIGLAAAQTKVARPADRAIDAEVDLGTNGEQPRRSHIRYEFFVFPCELRAGRVSVVLS